MRVSKVISLKNSFYIEFETSDEIHNSDLLCLNYNEEDYYFEITEVSTISGDFPMMRVIAMNVGYYNLFKKVGKFDIRKLLNKHLAKATDPEIIKKVSKERCYL